MVQFKSGDDLRHWVGSVVITPAQVVSGIVRVYCETEEDQLAAQVDEDMLFREISNHNAEITEDEAEVIVRYLLSRCKSTHARQQDPRLMLNFLCEWL